ncbi:carboxypeptidase-like regulatory domain-containing protein [Salinimicrobium sp. MT39]|uniref:Carboxypeptidase-like regulatory domain-containing protein n=1 Tax=Salinimicrobium profundisediminis TaxID=2994553 RepID=A0A9X3CUH3_9FLAO|nr:carboxypeptidase-like regulatory domain-containing protein [Salinimicrobium profundisediminis]MCX2837101.1 carboxypeptidase-like regulatory domain-containing protein [Salinimicrobium profundisediminis]
MDHFRKIFFFLISIFITSISCSQTEISGQVFGDQDEKLSGAMVMVSKDSVSSILAYGISDANGKFKIAVKNGSNSLFLKVSHMGFGTFKKTIQNKAQTLEVKLSPSSESLKEVIVKSEILRQHGDTLSFSIAAYKGKNDRVIADVLRKLPGIDIRPNGQIFYQDEPIQKYYIEGLDLLEGRYNVANNNLSAEAVSRVEILENHQPVKVLDSLVFSERASLNIKLKKDVTFSGTATAGIGAAPLLWQTKVTPMIFTKKQQAIVTYQSNNTGSDVSGEIRNFSIKYAGENFDIDNNDWLSIENVSAPPFSTERWLDNNVHLGSANILHRIKEDIDLKLNISYLNDYQQQDGVTQTRYFTPTDTIDVVENTNNDIFLSKLEGLLTLENNANKNYLKNQLEFNGSWNANRGLIDRTDTQIKQQLENPFFGIKNDLRLLRTLGKQLITFNSNTGFTENNQDLLVQPGQFEAIFNEGDPYGKIQQLVSSRKIYTDNSAGFTKALGKFTMSPKFGFSIQNQQLDTDILIEGEEVLEADFKNRNEFVQTSVYLKNSFRFKSKDETWNLRLSTPLEFKSFHLEDDNFEDSRNLDRLVFEPNFFVKKKISAFWEANASAGLRYNFGELQQLYYGFLLYGYRNLNRYNAPISEEIQQNYSGGLNYRNPLKQLFLNASYSYAYSENNLLYSSNIGENGTTILEAVARNNSFDNHSFRAGGSKYFRKLKTTLKLNASYNLSKRQQLLNNTLAEVNTQSFNLRGSVEAEILSWLIASYSGNFSTYTSGFEANNFQQIENQQHMLDLYFYPKDNQYISVSGEYYDNSLSEKGDNYFVNLDYQFTFPKSKMDLNISWRNVLNIDEFINAYNNQYYYVESSYRLRPSQVLATLKFTL